MKVAVFSTKPYDRVALTGANEAFQHELTFFEPALEERTAILAQGADAVCIFVNDVADAAVLRQLADLGIRAVALRCAGFNNVDLAAAEEAGIPVARVPAYSPHAVAEHAVALLLALNRHIHKAYNRVREGNFGLNGLLGYDLHGKTVGVVGTGHIGQVFSRIMVGFGCRVIAFDVRENETCLSDGVTYVPLETLFAESDIISLHCPLNPHTHHLINLETISQMKRGVTVINTSRGALIDTVAAIQGLKSQKIGAMALDVYEEEAELFFEDLSDRIIDDDYFSRLQTFPNVLITGHQAFFTREAMGNIAATTLRNLSEMEASGTCENEVRAMG